MGGRKTTNHEFQTALQGKKIPLVILDPKWHGLFSDDGKPRSIVKLEKKANEYLKKQARLNQDIKDLKNLKEKLMKNINLPFSIKEFGVDEKEFYEKLDEMVELAFDDQCTGANPAYPLMSDIKQIYIDAFEGVVRDYYPAAKKSK